MTRDTGAQGGYKLVHVQYVALNYKDYMSLTAAAL